MLLVQLKTDLVVQVRLGREVGEGGGKRGAVLKTSDDERSASFASKWFNFDVSLSRSTEIYAPSMTSAISSLALTALSSRATTCSVTSPAVS